MILSERQRVELSDADRYIRNSDILRRTVLTVQVSEPAANWYLLANSQRGSQTRLHAQSAVGAVYQTHAELGEEMLATNKDITGFRTHRNWGRLSDARRLNSSPTAAIHRASTFKKVLFYVCEC